MTKDNFNFNIDYKAIEGLSKILSDSQLTEIEYEDQGRRVRLSRNSLVSNASIHNIPTSISLPNPTDGSSLVSNKAHIGAIPSPMVGIVYAAAEPGAAPFVSIGQKIEKNATICIIEAMKIMNPIKAPISGVVKEIFFKNSVPVEFGETLIIIE
jgi:acetyl-CoA carboxylase biotin carboxyl carrier protein